MNYKAFTLAALLGLCVPLVGCGDDSDAEETMEDAGDSMGDAMDDAADEMGDAAEDAGEEVEERMAD